MRDFKFLWRRLDKPNWHARTVSAPSPEEAIASLERILSRRVDFPHSVAVDHLFHEMTGGVSTVHLSMRNFDNPFPVVFANEVQHRALQGFVSGLIPFFERLALNLPDRV